MQLAASHLLGTHDFTSFAASDPDLSTRLEKSQSSRPEHGFTVMLSGETPVFPDSPNTRNLFHSEITLENDLLLYRVTGSGFLHHMVRNIVGTLVDVGRGALTPQDIPAILAAGDRTTAGPTAPPQGLFLIQVDYPGPQP